MKRAEIEVRAKDGSGVERSHLSDLESWQAITYQLILELELRGWRRSWLEAARANGWAYCRRRDALVRPASRVGR